jgi:hypothetical protein
MVINLQRIVALFNDVFHFVILLDLIKVDLFGVGIRVSHLGGRVSVI